MNKEFLSENLINNKNILKNSLNILKNIFNDQNDINYTNLNIFNDIIKKFDKFYYDILDKKYNHILSNKFLKESILIYINFFITDLNILIKRINDRNIIERIKKEVLPIEFIIKLKEYNHNNISSIKIIKIKHYLDNYNESIILL